MTKFNFDFLPKQLLIKLKIYAKNWIKMMLINSKAQSKYNLSIYIKKIKKKLLKPFYKKSGIQNFSGFRVRVWVSYPKKVGILGSGSGFIPEKSGYTGFGYGFGCGYPNPKPVFFWVLLYDYDPFFCLMSR